MEIAIGIAILRGHDADHFEWFAVELNLAAADSGIAAESSFPERMAQDGDARIGTLFLLGKGAAERWIDAQHARKVEGRAGSLEAFRIAQIFQGENFNYTPLIAAALLYLAVTVPLARVVDRMGGPEGTVR